MTTFDTAEPITLDVEAGAGSVLVEADATTTTEVELRPARHGDDDAQQLVDEARVELRGDTLLVHVPDDRRFGLLRRTPEVVVEVRLPVGSRVVVRTKSADVQVRGEVGDTKIETGSGDVQVADVDGVAAVESGSGDIQIGTIAGTAVVKSASGDVQIATCCSTAKVQTASGDASIGTAEAALDVRTASGDVRVGEADGPVSARTASGDISLARLRGDTVTALSASGDVDLSIEPGIAVWMEVSSVSGTVRSTLDRSERQPSDRPTIQVRANTTSGDITLRTA